MDPYQDEFLAVPEDADSERVLLTTLCVAPDNPEVPEVLHLLNGGESFLVTQHKAVYLAFKAIHERNEEITSIALKVECEAQGTLGRAGGLAGISEITTASEEVMHPLRLAQRLEELHQRRRMQRVIGNIMRQVSDPAVTLKALSEKLQVLAGASRPAESLLTICDASEFLHKDLPPPRWLIPGLIPLAVPVVVASKGGLGKSFLTLQMCIALATGKAFLNFEALPPMGAIYFGLEDDRETFNRRARSIIDHYRVCLDWTLDDDANLLRNFRTPYINWKAPGATGHLPALATSLTQLMQAMVEEGVAPGAAVIDTLARVSEGDENTVQALRPVLNSLNLILEYGWTPVVLHHVGKGQDGVKTPGAKKPLLGDRMSTEWVRGSSAIVDNFRAVIQITPLNTDEAGVAGLDEDKARQGGYAVFGATKLNGGQKADWVVLEQDDHGRWFAPRDGLETLARIRGARAVAALDKQICILIDLYEATRWGGQADLVELAKKHYPDKDISKAKNSLHQAISKLRRADLLQKIGHVPTLQGLQKIQVSDKGNKIE